MVTLSKPVNAHPHAISGSLLSADRLLTTNPLSNSQSFRLGQRSSLLQESTRAKRNFTLRGTNPVVTGVSGNGSTSTYNVEQMHNGGTWNFFRNGSFRFTPNGLGVFARTDLFPITGRYQGSNTIRFTGSRSSSDLTSRNSATVTGRISLRSGVASVSQRTVLIMSANINNTPFNQTIDRTVQLNLQMVRTRPS